ncbi:hypothetical protein PS2_001292 [Malus domestica]
MVAKADIHLWHRRLGHPSNAVLHSVLNNHHLPVTGSVNKMPFCVACRMGKASKLPFSVLPCTSVRPFHLVHADVWGPSPSLSCTGFKYYLIIVDDFTKYSWLYPLYLKSDVSSALITFVLKVQTLFASKVQCFRTDSGGEFLNHSLQAFFNDQGITHQLSCPHTPEQNGCAERKHRHVVEMGRTLLSQSGLPSKFWVEAFQTSVYLINRLPSQTSSLSPWTQLFQAPPKYHILKPFGCACYPWLKPYSSHKLEPKSKLCIFLGYSLNHSGYRCYDPVSEKLYISRHVVFDESTFPYLHPTFSPASSSVLPHSDPLPSSISVHIPVSSSSPPAVSPPQPFASPHVSTTPPTHDPTSSSSLPAAFSPDLVSGSPPPIGSPHNTHSMITRAKAGIHKPKVFTATKHPLPSSVDPLTQIPSAPTTYLQASKHAPWMAAMQDEFQALQSTGTWDLVPSHPSYNLVGCKWVFKVKHKADGSIDRYKARLVAKGFHQQEGLDFSETFSPVAKPPTIRILLSLAVHYDWFIHQLDVSNAFLHGQLKEDVYMESSIPTVKGRRSSERVEFIQIINI